MGMIKTKIGDILEKLAWLSKYIRLRETGRGFVEGAFKNTPIPYFILIDRPTMTSQGFTLFIEDLS
jgi:hypothetical protein